MTTPGHVSGHLQYYFLINIYNIFQFGQYPNPGAQLSPSSTQSGSNF